jgi:hypothetical protein
MPTRLSFGRRLAGPVAALALLAGCGTAIIPGSPSAAGKAPVGASPADTGTAVCSLFSPTEVKALIGISPAGEPGGGEFGGSSCQWQDLDDVESGTLTVEVGAPGSAPAGHLQAVKAEYGMEALPNGMARDLLGRVYFVCGASSECRVAVTGAATAANGSRINANLKAGIALVPTVRAKVGG